MHENNPHKHTPKKHRPAMVLSAGGAVALMNGPLAKAQEHLSVFLVACLIGLFSNIYARGTASPALIIIVNATFMLGAFSSRLIVR